MWPSIQAMRQLRQQLGSKFTNQLRGARDGVLSVMLRMPDGKSTRGRFDAHVTTQVQGTFTVDITGACTNLELLFSTAGLV